jgi:hypothetical protein
MNVIGKVMTSTYALPLESNEFGGEWADVPFCDFIYSVAGVNNHFALAGWMGLYQTYASQ